jgi:hypothetical protein
VTPEDVARWINALVKDPGLAASVVFSAVFVGRMIRRQIEERHREVIATLNDGFERIERSINNSVIQRDRALHEGRPL